MLALLTSIRPSDNARSWASSSELTVFPTKQGASDEIDRVMKLNAERVAANEDAI